MGGYVQGQDADLDVALQMWPQLVDHIRSRKHKKPILGPERSSGVVGRVGLNYVTSPRENHEKIALKQRLDVMRKSRSLAVLREELQKTESLCEQLDGILKDIMARTGEQSVASLRADSGTVPMFWNNSKRWKTEVNSCAPKFTMPIRNWRKRAAKARAQDAAKIQKRLRLEKTEQSGI